jgi:dipeptidyl aminopeptidase/acylaminoacyl peptidase
MKQQILSFVLIASLSACSSPTTAPITKADYDRAQSYLFENINNQQAFNLDIDPYWFRDNTGFWYLEHEKDAKIFKRLNFSDYEITDLFDHEVVANQFSELLGHHVDPYDLPFNSLWQRVDNNFRATIEGKDYLINLDTEEVTPDPDSPYATNPVERASPDGKWIAFTRDYNLFIRSVDTGREYQLSTRGEKGYEFGTYYGWYDKMEGENGERPLRFSVNWSPDSKWLQTSLVDFRNAEKMYLLDWSKDELFKPQLLSYYRGSPGDTNMVKVTPVFYDIDRRKEYFPDIPTGTHVNSASFRWHEAPDKVLVDYAERGYKTQHVLELDLAGKTLKPLVEETSNTNVDNFYYRYLRTENKLLFLSERSGWRQLYLHDLSTNQTRPLTTGNYFIDQVLTFDRYEKRVYFMASGKEPERNPYFSHLYSINIETNELKLLTLENAHHEVQLSQDNSHFFDNYSTYNQPTISVLKRASDGSLVKEVSKADISALTARGWMPPQAFVSIGRDGQTPVYGAMWKPSHFDPAKKYPVIDHSYTGPHTQMFPRNFRTVLARNNQALAELGFIVVMIDGMGTYGRSKEFHNYSYKNMGKNLTEHVSAIKELGDTYSWFDAERVGIFGHSAGGFDAGHAMLEFPDFYKVSVASSADHDFRMEKAWWPEMYMGWPVDSSYHQVSNITMAGNLKGKLLLVHGGLDDNVNPSATFKLAEALVKADKEFDLLILPGQRHGYRGEASKYFMKKRWNYFVKHLAGKEPIWDIDQE